MSAPFLLLTSLMDAGARSADLTRAHGDAMERLITAIGPAPILGMDLVELPLDEQSFGALRRALQLSGDDVAIYDIFPIAETNATVRKLAGQFLAAETVWLLEEQKQFGDVPMNLQLDYPEGWPRDPKSLQERLVAEGALQLTEEAVESFRVIKQAWDQSSR